MYRKLKAKLFQLDKIGADIVYTILEEEQCLSHKNKTIVRLGDNFYELRIPKQSKEGVFRVYFTIFPDNERIMILDAEYKTEKEPKRLKAAQNKLERLIKEVGWK
ncbi:hypothetical protein JYK00_03085 [Thermosipho ferrireducens]|uniref:Addiction module toxin RelE n=1 Tax=Thermosipho ferrireducens TaxID=2571116 RepID=A0ABX7SAZ8_9BACT|nr:hypothetical protein [Thermosipho ferrireducens]QTA38520.1 hypothetical protein JYK00_03085 [Thermosipho ferrireducens]